MSLALERRLKRALNYFPFSCLLCPAAFAVREDVALHFRLGPHGRTEERYAEALDEEKEGHLRVLLEGRRKKLSQNMSLEVKQEISGLETSRKKMPATSMKMPELDYKEPRSPAVNIRSKRHMEPRSSSEDTLQSLLNSTLDSIAPESKAKLSLLSVTASSQSSPDANSTGSFELQDSVSALAAPMLLSAEEEAEADETAMFQPEEESEAEEIDDTNQSELKKWSFQADASAFEPPDESKEGFRMSSFASDLSENLVSTKENIGMSADEQSFDEQMPSLEPMEDPSSVASSFGSADHSDIGLAQPFLAESSLASSASQSWRLGGSRTGDSPMPDEPLPLSVDEVFRQQPPQALTAASFPLKPGSIQPQRPDLRRPYRTTFCRACQRFVGARMQHLASKHLGAVTWMCTPCGTWTKAWQRCGLRHEATCRGDAVRDLRATLRPRIQQLVEIVYQKSHAPLSASEEVTLLAASLHGVRRPSGAPTPTPLASARPSVLVSTRALKALPVPATLPTDLPPASAANASSEPAAEALEEDKDKVRKKKFECRECKATFARAEHGHRHAMNKHVKDAVYSCNVCPFTERAVDKRPKMRKHCLAKHGSSELFVDRRESVRDFVNALIVRLAA